MSLFKKKDTTKDSTCCCGGNCAHEDTKKQETDNAGCARIKILGSGCANCQSLEAATREALTEMGKNPEINHVTDFAQIAGYGVMSTPALVVDEKVVSYGRVLKKDEVRDILEKIL